MQSWAVDFYKSQAWKNTRKAYAASVGGLCERCRANGLIVAGEIVHHKTHLTPFNIHDESITLNPDNLMLVCRDCHAKEHATPKRYTIDQNGRVTT